MSGKVDDPAQGSYLPEELVGQLNGLGFVLLEGQRSAYVFARSAIGSHVQLTVEAIGQDVWRIGVKWRQPEEVGRLPTPLISMSLGSLAQSTDGDTIDLPTSQMVAQLPSLMADSVLPLVDLAPS